MNDVIQPTGSELAQPRKGMPDWAANYLEALEKTGGLKVEAAKLIGKSYSAVYKASREYHDFAQEVDRLKAYLDSKTLDELEGLSITQARKPGCITERILQLKRLDPANYREKSQPQGANFIINFGFPVPTDVNAGSREIPAAAEVVGSIARKPRKKLARPILTEEDLGF